MEFKMDRPGNRLIFGIASLIIGLDIAALFIFFARSMSFFAIVMGVSALCLGIHIMVTHRAYSRRYSNDREQGFATPVAPDGTDLVPNVEIWQKQQAGDLTFDSPLEVKLKIIFAIAGMIGLTLASIIDRTPEYLIGVLVVITVFSFYLRKLSRRAHWWADKMSIYASILLICITPVVFHFLLKDNASLKDLILSPIVLLSWAGALIRETIIERPKLINGERIKEDNGEHWG